MSNNNQGWLWLIAGAFLAWHSSVPDHVSYQGSRLLGFPTAPTKRVLEVEVERVASIYRLPRGVFHALVRVESGYNPNALSPVGARGIAQIMPFNHLRCGLETPDALWDATSNLRCGAQILREEIDRLGNLEDALTVYNCGKVRCREGRQYANKVLSIARALG